MLNLIMIMLDWKGCILIKLKAQVEKIVVSSELLEQRKFSYGQIYGALSRVTTLTGWHTVDSFNVNAIRANP